MAQKSKSGRTAPRPSDLEEEDDEDDEAPSTSRAKATQAKVRDVAYLVFIKMLLKCMERI